MDNSQQPKTNTTLELIDMLVAKHGINRDKTINYIDKNYNRNSSFKLFLSGLIYNLSVNYNNLKEDLK